MDELREYINHFIKLDNKDWEQFSSLFEIVEYKKGEHIFGTSDVSEAIYFIIDGIVRSYTLDSAGKDFTWTFHCLTTDTLENRMLIDIGVVDYVSFTQGTPEELAFEVLMDSKLVKIDKKDLLSLYDSDIKWQKFATKMAEDSYAVIRKRTLNLLTKNAKERFDLLISYFPYVFEKNVLVDHIASYLGMTRQSLSRLQREKEHEPK